MELLKKITSSTIQPLSPASHARNADSLQLNLIRALLLEEIKEDPGLMRAARACSSFLEQASPVELALVTNDVLDVLKRRAEECGEEGLDWDDASDMESAGHEDQSDSALDFDELERAADYDPMVDESGDEEDGRNRGSDVEEEEEEEEDEDGLDWAGKPINKRNKEEKTEGGTIRRKGGDVFVDSSSEEEMGGGRNKRDENEAEEEDSEIMEKMKALPTSLTSHLGALSDATNRLEKQLIERRSWELLGEADTTKRPEDSLLAPGAGAKRLADAITVDTARPIGKPTLERASEMEEMIKTRIKARNFDNITTTKTPEDTTKSKKSNEGEGEEMTKGIFGDAMDGERKSLNELFEADAMRLKPAPKDVPEEIVKLRIQAVSKWRKISQELEGMFYK